jgi:D-hydroxyproline dehydrogenase subunit gamma
VGEPRSRDAPADDLRVGGSSDRSGIDRGPAFTFRFDGHEIDAHPGETIAGALLAAGHRQLRSTRVGGRPRGLFCAIGACFECLVRVDGNRPVRACLTAAGPDMEVGPGDLDTGVGREGREGRTGEPRHGGRP